MWDEKAQKPKRNHPNKLFIESIIDEKKKDYREKILELNAMGKDYTPETLVSAVEKVVQKTLTVGSYFKEHIEAMEKARQLRNSKVYGETAHVVQQFHGTKDLLFSDIDVRWLNKFEIYSGALLASVL